MNKKPLLNQMFASVPRRYDLVNRFVTLGQDSRWRGVAIRACLSNHPRRVLDLCTGTGDLAVGLALSEGAPKKVVAIDFTPQMLKEGVLKASEAGVISRIDFGLADVASLPFCDSVFDAVTISFGFRNLTHENRYRDIHLNEMFRVLAKGGRLVIVESSQPTSLLLRVGFKVFLKGFVAPFGRLVTGDSRAYKYLAHSAANFYSAEEVKELLLKVGFTDVDTTQLFAGAAAVHVAIKK